MFGLEERKKIPLTRPFTSLRYAKARPLPQGERYPYQSLKIATTARDDEIVQLDTSPLVGEVVILQALAEQNGG